jgi:hypothetical protein
MKANKHAQAPKTWSNPGFFHYSATVLMGVALVLSVSVVDPQPHRPAQTNPAPVQALALNSIRAQMQLQIMQNDIVGAAKTLMAAKDVHGRSAEFASLLSQIRGMAQEKSLPAVKVLTSTQTQDLPAGIQRLILNPEEATTVQPATAAFFADHASHMTNGDVPVPVTQPETRNDENETQEERVRAIQERIQDSLRQKQEIEASLTAQAKRSGHRLPTGQV